jgi:GNAT superfamily N-acetyltransferase
VLALEALEPEQLDAIAALCARSIGDPPSTHELAATLFAPDQPAIVRGDPEIGVVATVAGSDRGFVRLLVVDAAHRGRGYGHELLEAAERDLVHLGQVQIGADPPYYLWPGAPATEIELLCLLERRKYTRAEANFHMAVDLADLPDDCGGYEVAGESARAEVAAFTDANYAHWTPEVLRALDNDSLLVARDDKGVSAFCAYDVNRRGLLGPIGARLDLVGRGVAHPLLVGALHRMREEGQDRIEVSWVGPIVPYARVGGVVSRVFFVYRKDLR